MPPRGGRWAGNLEVLRDANAKAATVSCVAPGNLARSSGAVSARREEPGLASRLWSFQPFQVEGA